MDKGKLVVASLIAALGVSACAGVSESIQRVEERVKAKREAQAQQQVQQEQQGKGEQPSQQASAVPALAEESAVAKGPLVGKVFQNPYSELEKRFKINRGIQFGAFGKQTVAFDVTAKAGRRVVVFRQKGEEKWLVTGDMSVPVPAKGLVFVGTAEEDETGEGDPKTVCTAGGKTVQAFGFMKGSKKRFDQPAGSLAWAVDGEGKPAPVTKLVCKY